VAVQAEVPYAACGGWLRSGYARALGVASYPQPSTAILDMEFEMEEELLATCGFERERESEREREREREREKERESSGGSSSFI